jgi:anti-sigma regulatory factor (Ser/Thr protein kinase)
VAVEEGIAGYVFRSGEGVLSPDVAQDPRHSEQVDLATHYRTRSMVTAPLITTQPRCIGVMQVLNRRRGSFDEGDLKTLEILCVQAAVGIEAAQLHEAMLATEREKRRFACEVLRCVTGDKLRLVDPSALPTEGEVIARLDLTQRDSYARLRETIEEGARRAGMDPDLVHDLVLAASEAATNTMKHGVRGQAEVRATPDSLRVHVSDEGPGIRPEDLPRVLFQVGFSTKVSLGMGYTLMLELADRVWLATGPEGTHLVLEKCLHRPQAHAEPFDELLERFPHSASL